MTSPSQIPVPIRAQRLHAPQRERGNERTVTASRPRNLRGQRATPMLSPSALTLRYRRAQNDLVRQSTRESHPLPTVGTNERDESEAGSDSTVTPKSYRCKANKLKNKSSSDGQHTAKRSVTITPADTESGFWQAEPGKSLPTLSPQPEQVESLDSPGVLPPITPTATFGPSSRNDVSTTSQSILHHSHSSNDQSSARSRDNSRRRVTFNEEVQVRFFDNSDAPVFRSNGDNETWHSAFYDEVPLTHDDDGESVQQESTTTPLEEENGGAMSAHARLRIVMLLGEHSSKRGGIYGRQ